VGRPLTIRLGVRGSVKLPQRGPGPKMDCMHILGQEEAIWNTIFSIYERRRGPPNVAGPEKTSPFPSLSTGLLQRYCSTFMSDSRVTRCERQDEVFN